MKKIKIFIRKVTEERVGSGIGSESGSISQSYVFGDPDPHRNVTDPQHSFLAQREPFDLGGLVYHKNYKYQKKCTVKMLSFLSSLVRYGTRIPPSPPPGRGRAGTRWSSPAQADPPPRTSWLIS
jgi:hypothetical protein